jgi:PKD repeat protein
MSFLNKITFLLLLAILSGSCKKPGYPVPPASTVPKFSYTVTNDGYAPATVTFTNESIIPEPAGSPSYFWNFGDGSSATVENPTHDYPAPGVYEVKLVVSMSVSLEIKELAQTVVVMNRNASGTPMYFTNGKNVFMGLVNEHAPIFTALPIGPFQDSYDLAFDTINNKLYISDFDASAIYRCDPDGSNLVEFRTNLPGPDGMEIDYANNMLYWDTDDGIQRADLSSTDVGQLENFVTGQANDPEGVSIDPVNSKLYWTNYNGGVWMKNLDGTGETEIIPLIEGGSTLVVGDRLFFDQYVASGDIQIKSSKLDGTGISTISTGNTKVVFGIGYEAGGGKIYWGDRSIGEIKRANTDGSSVETFYQSNGSSPRGIVFGKKITGSDK